MDTVKSIAVGLFMFVATGLIAFVASFVYKKLRDFVEAVRSQGTVLLDIEAAAERHYDEDKLLFQTIHEKIGETQMENRARFQRLEDQAAGRYSNGVLDEKFKQKDIEINNLQERVDNVEQNIVAHIDRSTAVILEKLNSRNKGKE